MKRTLRHITILVAVVTSIGTAMGCEMGTPQQAQRIGERPVARDAGPTGRVRALHIAPQAPALALTFDDGRPMADAIVFGGTTNDLDMPSGDHSFTVAIANEGTIMATSDNSILAERGAALVVWGDLSEMNATLIPDATERGYRFMNAIPGGRVVGLSSGGGIEPLTAGAITGSRDGDGSLRVDLDNDGDVDATYTLPTPEEGDNGNVDVFCVGPTEPAPVDPSEPAPPSDGGIVVVASTSDGLVIVQPDGPTPPARLRAVHLSPNAPDVDVFVDGSRAIRGLPFENASPYAELPGNAYDIAVSVTGTDEASAVLRVDNLEIFAARSFSAVAFGNLPNIRALALEDDYRPTAPGKIRVRAAHTADGVGQVDVLAVTSNGNALVFDDLDFGNATDSIEIDAAAITLGLDLDDDNNPELVFNVPALPVGTVATLFAVVDADGVALFAALEDGTATIRGAAPAPPAAPANIRVVHLAPEAPAVAVNANGVRVVETLSFLNATQFAQVDSGTTDLDIALATAPDAALLSLTNAELAPESFTTAVAFGRLDDLRVLALAEDRSPVANDNIRVRAIHTAVGVGNVDIYANGALIVDDLAFGTAGDYLEVPAGIYTIGLDLNEDGTADLHFQLPHLAAGTIGNIFAVTDAAGNATLALQP